MSHTIIREITSDNDVQQLTLSALSKIEKVVGDTLGYRGGFNIIENSSGLPELTKDGWTSLKELCFENPIENLVLEIVKEATMKTFDEIADNTSTTTILVCNLFKNSLDELKKGKSSIDIQKETEESVQKIMDYIDKIKVPLTDKLMYDVAKTSANSDEFIAKIVTDAFIKAGEYGSVSHKRTMSDKTEIEFIEGNPIDSGFAHEGYITVQETQSVVYDNPLVLVAETYFQTINEVIPFLDIAFPQNIEGVPYIEPRPLVIVGHMDDNISNALLQNKLQYNLPIAVIKPPYTHRKGREVMSDLALILGCEVLDGISRSDYGGKEKSHLGNCQRIEITSKDSVITIDKTLNIDKIQGRINELKEQIKNSKHEGEKNYLKERIARINGGIATIKVGGITSSEIEERLARVDDCLGAVRSAKEEGVVSGGGITLEYASMELNIDDVTKESIKAPQKKILLNAGKSNTDINFSAYKLKKGEQDYNIGYDVKSYEVKNMFDEGILDTAKGIKSALRNSVSASNNLLRTQNVLSYQRAKNGN